MHKQKAFGKFALLNAFYINSLSSVPEELDAAFWKVEARFESLALNLGNELLHAIVRVLLGHSGESALVGAESNHLRLLRSQIENALAFSVQSCFHPEEFHTLSVQIRQNLAHIANLALLVATLREECNNAKAVIIAEVVEGLRDGSLLFGLELDWLLDYGGLEGLRRCLNDGL